MGRGGGWGAKQGRCRMQDAGAGAGAAVAGCGTTGIEKVKETPHLSFPGVLFCIFIFKDPEGTTTGKSSRLASPLSPSHTYCN